MFPAESNYSYQTILISTKSLVPADIPSTMKHDTGASGSSVLLWWPVTVVISMYIRTQPAIPCLDCFCVLKKWINMTFLKLALLSSSDGWLSLLLAHTYVYMYTHKSFKLVFYHSHYVVSVCHSNEFWSLTHCMNIKQRLVAESQVRLFWMLG
jgi:hypothetical protein